MKSLIFIIAFLVISNFGRAETIEVSIGFTYTQKSASQYVLKSTVIDDEDEVPVVGIDINYVVEVNGETIQLGSSVTASNGVSVYTGNLSELRKKGHQFKFSAIFAGNDEYEENSAELEITDVMLLVKTEIVDSVNTVFISLTKWDEDDETVPISDEDVKLYVPRMYSLLPITEAYTSEEGSDAVEFPNDVPGGPAGELVIISRLEEHDAFGTVEVQSNTSWGIPVSQSNGRLPRALWSPDAPMWMVITFIILMTGVWGHYLWIIYNLFKIKELQEKDAPINYAE